MGWKLDFESEKLLLKKRGEKKEREQKEKRQEGERKAREKERERKRERESPQTELGRIQAQLGHQVFLFSRWTRNL